MTAEATIAAAKVISVSIEAPASQSVRPRLNRRSLEAIRVLEACGRFTLARFGERERDMLKARGRNPL
ncbi:hypothetical protein T281_16765 [Rhodomicrobium udaipurense JA643]|nr:hypothetical protein T281_16765 [Rhodomicrobium udaipurense JA643]